MYYLTFIYFINFIGLLGALWVLLTSFLHSSFSKWRKQCSSSLYSNVNLVATTGHFTVVAAVSSEVLLLKKFVDGLFLFIKFSFRCIYWQWTKKKKNTFSFIAPTYSGYLYTKNNCHVSNVCVFVEGL